MTQSFFDLLNDATQLLLDHPEDVRDLIYWAVSLDDEARSAMIMAYRNLKDKDE